MLDLVTGRASHPAELTAPGIQFTRGSLEVTIARHALLIRATDWNTIVATSVVAPKISVAFGPGFNAPATTRNRFQYLADRMVTEASSGFNFFGIASAKSGRHYVAIIALGNLTSDRYKLADLRFTATASSPSTVLASGTFFPTHRGSVSISPHQVVFLRLALRPQHERPPRANTITYNMHYGWLFQCDPDRCGSR